MAHHLELTIAELAALPANSLLSAVSDAESVRLHVEKPLALDDVQLCIFLVAVARRRARLDVVFPFGQASRETADSLDATVLGPLLWRNGPRRNITFSTDEFLRPLPPFADAARRLLYIHTSDFSVSTREQFSTDLAHGLRAAGIFVPRAVFNAVTRIGFEVNSNAEEYGTFDEQGNQVESFRFFSVAIRNRLSASAATIAGDYLREYESTHSQASEWLQVLVVDSGVGMAYPSYFVSSTAQSRSNRDVYLADVFEEKKQLKFVLEEYESTKGKFGRRLNLQTVVGEGTKIVRQQIATVRGFAGVRTGRCAATWWHASRTLTRLEFKMLPKFEVDAEMGGLFRGTIWQILIPLDTQFSLL